MNKIPSIVAVVAATVCAADAAAQASKTKVVPVSATTVEGATSTYFPFLYDKMRVQQIWHGAAVTSSTALLTGLKFRGDAKASASAATISNLTVNLSSTTVTPASMTTAFAKNITAKVQTKVFSGTYKLPALSPPKVAPAAFSVSFAWPKPFLFNGTKGNLLMEWIVPGNAQSKTAYNLDATTTAGGTGSATPFGTSGKFSNGDVLKFSVNTGNLKLGGSLDLAVSGMSKVYPTNLILGLSNKTFGGSKLPLGLGFIGAPNNNLYVSMEAVVPLKVSGSAGQFFSVFNAKIPNLKILNGLTGYAQTYFGDPKANAAGLVASHGMTVSLGSGQSPTQVLGSSNSAAATGFFAFGNNTQGGAVTQFVGTIP